MPGVSALTWGVVGLAQLGEWLGMGGSGASAVSLPMEVGLGRRPTVSGETPRGTAFPRLAGPKGRAWGCCCCLVEHGR